MPDKKISELTEQTILTDNDEFPIIRNEGGTYVNYKVKKVNVVSMPDATASIKGAIRLTGDLGGTASSPTVPGLANVAKTNITQQFGSFQGSTRVSQNISGSVVINCALGNIYDLTLTGNVTNFNVSNLQSGFLTFNIIQGATPYTFSFGTGNSTFKLKKNDNSAVSIIANEITKLSCESNGTTIQYVVGVWVS